MADNKSGASDAALGWGIMLCIFAALGYLVWTIFHEQIRSIIRWLRVGEMSVASIFLGDNYTVEWSGQDVNYHQMLAAAKEVPAEQIDNTMLGALSLIGLQPYTYLVVAITLAFAFWALFRGPGSEHRVKFSIDTLIKKQSNIFPIIAPMINFNPMKQPSRPPGAPVPADLPLFAEALSPEEWIVFNEIPVSGKDLNEEAVMRAFSKQLGGRWRGAKHLPPYMQVMLAAFCLKASRRRADSDTMMSRLALCWTENKLNIDRALLREARSVLANKDISASTLRKCNEHAWETTAMIRALNAAREEGGVLAPAQFIWLRAYNRALWYPLNNLGRQSLNMEAIGAMAHYKAEKLAQRPIPRPKVNDAVISTVEYMKSSAARALPTLDYSGSKRRGIKKLKTKTA